MFRLRRSHLWVPFVFIFTACESEQDAATPTPSSSPVQLDTPPLAFRSVLDGRPRALTLRLPNAHFVAFTADTGALLKVWSGELDTKGAVFDQRHGPQPESAGVQYWQGEQTRWLHGDTPLTYAGYAIDQGRVTLMRAAGAVTVNEQVELLGTDHGVRLLRHFEVSGLEEGDTITLQGLHAPAISAEGALVREDTAFQLANGASRIAMELNAIERESEKVVEQPPGLLAIQNSDCAACHNPSVKTVGPAYIQIASRYHGDDEAYGALVRKIIEGGSGQWGEVPMTPHPGLSEAEAGVMVDYILSLHQPEPLGDKELLLDQPGPDFEMFEAIPDEVPMDAGAMVYLHYFSGDQPNIDDVKSGAPALAGHVPYLHWPTVAAFKPEQERFTYQVLTHLKLDRPMNTTLRLVSDDGAYLYLNGEQIIDNWGFHAPEAVDAEVQLPAGEHALEIIYVQGAAGAALSLQWLNQESGEFEVVPASYFAVKPSDVREVEPVVTDPDRIKSIPGDRIEVAGVHPAFDLFQARPEAFEPMVGGLDLLDENRLVVSTWDPHGSVYIVEHFRSDDPAQIRVQRIAHGLAEPLGVKVVEGEIYVMQKQELTHLVDRDGDGITDLYAKVANDWQVTDNFHEFAFGLEYEDGHFYATLATGVLPGGASAQPQSPDRGKAVRISRETGAVEFIASGLRTPNGIGYGIDGAMFIADNQGDWLPASKIVELTPGAWYGSRSVDFEGTVSLSEVKPVVWLPQDEIGNSPSEPAPLHVGPYQNQMVHGEVTHGGLKRVYAERVNGRLQGAVFRFTQGLEAGVNRLQWIDDDELIIGGIGNPGNWAHGDALWYGLQRLKYNGQTAFEMLSVSAHSDGFEIAFTDAIAVGQQLSANDFRVEQWYYEPSAEYGGPKLDHRALDITHFSLSPDRRRVQLQLAGLKPDHVVYFRITRPFHSASDRSLWTTEAWYTLNALPTNKPLALNEDYQVTHNTLSEAEKNAGWQLLFNGKDLGHFRNYNQDAPGARWGIDADTLHFSGKAVGEEGWQAQKGGDLVITPEPVTHYELYLEWKLEKKGNSGIIYNVKERLDLEHPFMSGPEYQLLDNIGHPDGRIETHRAGDLYDLIKTRFVTVNEAGEWNRSRLIVREGHLEHWLNGYKVVETTLYDDAWFAMLANSKFADWPDFGKTPGGHIVLQDHGDKVWFRNIKIKIFE